MSVRIPTIPTLVLALLAVSASRAGAQRRPSEGYPGTGWRPEPAGWVSLSFVVADAVGETEETVDRGYGLVIDGSMALGGGGPLSLRGSLGWTMYGHESVDVCVAGRVGCTAFVDMDTSNHIFFGEIGPELVFPTGPLRPYVNAGVGFSWFMTTTRVSGADAWGAHGDTDVFEDLAASVAFGGGLRALLKGGSSPLFLDLGVRYRHNEEADYLVESPTGGGAYETVRSETDLVHYRIGVAVGLPRADSGHGRHPYH